jgi:hypothetical protein
MWTPRAIASRFAAAQFSRMRSNSNSASKLKIPIANRPIGVDPSKLSSTDTNLAPAVFKRLIDSSASIAERANRSSRATTMPPVSPRSHRPRVSWNMGRSSFAPDSSISSHHCTISTSCNSAHFAIFCRCTSGEMNDSPSRPPRLDTRR